MPKCNCAGNACNCLVTAGTGITVSGTGNATAPYVIGVTGVIVERAIAADEVLDLTFSDTGDIIDLDLSANITGVTLPSGATMIEVVLRHSAGGTTVTWPSEILWPGGTEPAQSATPGGIDWFLFRRVGENWIGTLIAGDVY